MEPLRGEVWEKALHYARQAGARALARSANQEAVTSFEGALAALQHLPDSPERCAPAIDLRFDLRASLVPLGEYGRLLDCLRDLFQRRRFPLGRSARRVFVQNIRPRMGVRRCDEEVRNPRGAPHGLLELGEPVDWKFVQERLGHASVVTTIETYVHLTNEDRKHAYDRYSEKRKEAHARHEDRSDPCQL